MKYLRKQDPVEATPYKPGMEDGRRNGIAYIVVGDLFEMSVREGDYILTFNDGSRSVITKENLERLFEPYIEK